MTEHSPAHAVDVVVCPSCGEIYESPEQALAVLLNSGYCVNLTCLQNLSGHPLSAIRSREKSDRRATDLRAS